MAADPIKACKPQPLPELDSLDIPKTDDEDAGGDDGDVKAGSSVACKDTYVEGRSSVGDLLRQQQIDGRKAHVRGLWAQLAKRVESDE